MNRQDAIDEVRDEHRDEDQEDQGTEGKSDGDSSTGRPISIRRSSTFKEIH